MAQTDLTQYATALLDSGVTEAQILATGITHSSSGSWYSYNNRDLAAFEALEATLTQVTFTKVNGDWGVKGRNLEAGKEVTITKRDGSTKTAWAVAIATDVDGVQTATITFEAPAPVAPTPVTGQASTPAPRKGWSKQSRYGYSRQASGHYTTTCSMCGSREVSPGVCDDC